MSVPVKTEEFAIIANGERDTENVLALIDGDVATLWESSNLDAASANDLIVFELNPRRTIEQVKIRIDQWNRWLCFGVAQEEPTGKESFTTVAEFDTLNGVDSNGVVIERNVALTFNLPDYFASKYLAIYAKDEEDGSLVPVVVEPVDPPEGDEGDDGEETTTVEQETRRNGIYEVSFERRQLNVYDISPEYKIKPSGAVTSYNYAGNANTIIDGNWNSYWEGNSYTSGGQDFIGLRFANPVQVGRIKIKFVRWGSRLKFGYFNGVPSNRNQIIPIRTVESNVAFKDDVGVQAARYITLTFDIPPYPASTGFYVYMESNGGGPLSDSGTSNTRTGVYEIEAYPSVIDLPPAIKGEWETDGYEKIEYVAYSNHMAGIETLNDEETHSATTWRPIQSTKLILDLGEPVAVSRIVASFAAWKYGFTVRGSSADSASAVLDAPDSELITTIRFNEVIDSGGKLSAMEELAFNFDNDKAHRFYVIEPLIAGSVTITEPEPYEEGSIVYGISNLIVLAKENWRDTAKFPEANPFIASSLPSAPYGEVDGWKRSVFDTSGTYTFVPDADTKALFVVAYGAGAGGLISYDNEDIQNPGGSTIIDGESGRILEAFGGEDYRIVYADQQVHSPFPRLFFESENNKVGKSFDAYYTPPTPNNVGVAGAVNDFSDFVDSPQDDLYIRETEYNFQTSNALATSAISGMSRTTAGYGSSASLTTAIKTHFVEFAPIELQGWSVVIFDVYWPSSASGHAQTTVSVGDVSATVERKSNTVVQVAIKVPEAGEYAIKFTIVNTSSSSISTSILPKLRKITYRTSPVAVRSGASGTKTKVLMLPEILTLQVGSGGKAVVGSFIDTAQARVKSGNANGGTSGADGGDGAVVIYQYKERLNYTVTPDQLIWEKFNNVKVPDGYTRTIYEARAGEGFVSYRHKLKASTKRLVVIVVGVGASRASGRQNPLTIEARDTTLIGENFKIVAGGGLPGYHGGGGSPPERQGTPGVVKEVEGAHLLPSVTAKLATYLSGSTTQYNNVFELGGAGRGIGSHYNEGAAGEGAVAFCSIEVADLVDRTLEITTATVSPTYGGRIVGGSGGGVVIFESDTSEGGIVSQSAMLVLKDDGESPNEVSQTAMLVLKDDGEAPNQVTQTAMLVLKDDGEAPNQVTQNAQLVLAKDDSYDLRLTQAFLQCVVEGDYGFLRTGTLLKEIAVKAEDTMLRVGTLLKEIVVKSEEPPIMVSQTVQTLLTRLDPSRLYLLEFGTLRYPTPGEVYESEITDVIGVEGSLLVQLEGEFAEGTYIVLNGERIDGYSFYIKNGDTVQIIGGVSNWFTPALTVYSYKYRDGQIERDIAGVWEVINHEFGPLKRAIISAKATYNGMLATLANGVKYVSHNFKSGKINYAELDGPSAVEAKANVVDDWSLTATEATKQHVDTVEHCYKLNPQSSDDTFGWDAIESKVSDTPTVQHKYEFVHRDASLDYVGQGFKLYAKPKFSFRGIEFTSSRQAFEVYVPHVYASSALIHVTDINFDSFFTTLDRFKVAYSEQQFAASGIDKRSYAELEFAESGIDKRSYAEQRFGESGIDKRAYAEHHFMEVSNIRRAIVGFDFIMPDTETIVPVANDWLNQSNTTVANRIRTYTASGKVQLYTYRVDAVAARLASAAFQIGAIEQKLNQYSVETNFDIVKYAAEMRDRLEVIVAQAGKNQIDKPETYMGFSTEKDAMQYASVFEGPYAIPKLEGFVYRVYSDDTTVCEVRGANMPIAWLLRGG